MNLVSISNSDYGRVRLVGGSAPDEGRVEIFYNNEWVTICDDYWQREEAEVICRQLGYIDVDEFYDRAHFGEGYGPILGQMSCDGNEAYWQQCLYIGWGTTGCSHSEDVGVRCLSETSLPNGGIAGVVIFVAFVAVFIGVVFYIHANHPRRTEEELVIGNHTLL
ncbi:putative macrophage scavenger receptor types I and II isoform X1 [Apostichopus japonicus]|uniref:Putative macrophage scavenger receptor types I and II isoform X1 n=1 Tax=Stichopus japonicus TaxID=307972 RepID=A0A2G8KW00_STIJA|nr:putative macrophage scavenger receptor types I and II isoform X1 [Apostichopus japonicus]